MEASIKCEINKIFNKYKDKFKKQEYKSKRLTEYEEAFGFNEESRKGSKPFSNTLGYFMEEIWLISPCIKMERCKNIGIDACSDMSNFQFKNRYDTMKGSQAYSEISKMVINSIKKDVNFYLVILVDKDNNSRNIPLHLFYGLSKIKKIKGYHEDKHRMISGKYAYKYFFGKDYKEIKSYILYLISTLN